MFWKEHVISNPKITELIESDDDVTLEAIMDENDILEECKLQNKALIGFLTLPDKMERMIDFIIKEPADNVDETVRYKYPNIACELLTSDVDQITDALVNNNDYLDRLYSFLECKTEKEEENECKAVKELNPLLASFFSKVLSLLLTKRTDLIMEYLKKNDFVNLLIYHLSTSAIMDIWVKLVTCTEDSEMRSKIFDWLSSEKAVEKLVASIDCSVDEKCHTNASQTLCDIIRKSREHLSQWQEKAQLDLLLEDIQSTEMICKLFEHMLQGEKMESVIVNGILVILALLEFRKPQSPLLPCAGLISNCNSLPKSDDHPAANHDPNALTALDTQRMEQSIQQTFAALRTKLQDLHQLLQDPPKRNVIWLEGEEGSWAVASLGRARLQVIKLVVALVRANVHSINLQLHQLGFLNIFFDLFFEYSHNNFLHTQLDQCIDVILSNPPVKNEDDSDSEPSNVLLNQLFDQIGIIQRILDAWELNEAEQSKPGAHRKAYMGHLTNIANHVIFNMQNGPNSKLVENYIKELPEDLNEKWTNFVSGPLAEINTQNTIKPVEIVQKPVTEVESVYSNLSRSHDSALQQAFSDYQMQQMTSNFSDQFGLQEDEFADHDASSIIPGAISTGMSFNLSLDAHSSVEMFEKICRQRLEMANDGSSDDDLWDDKDQEITYTSDTLRKRTSSENSHSSASTDSDEEGETFSDRSTGFGGTTPGTTQSSSSDDAKMEIDASDEWTANFDTAPMDEPSQAMDIQDIWNSQSDSSSKPDNWANFATFDSDFSCNDPFASSAPPSDASKKSSVQMDTTDTSQTKSDEIVNMNGAISNDSNEIQPYSETTNSSNMDSTDSNSRLKHTSAFPADSDKAESNLKNESPSPKNEGSNPESCTANKIENVENSSSALPVNSESAHNGPA